VTKTLRIAVVAAALALVPSALAAVEVKNTDTSDFPTVKATVLSPTQPRVVEGGGPAAGYEVENLGRAKSVVLAIDRSASMKGQSLVDAAAAARSFVEAKPAADRIAVTAFGSDALELTGFSTATIDVDTALRTLFVDQEQGTALHDAIVVSAQKLATEPFLARVIIVLTDGRDVSSSATLEEAIAAAQEVGAAVYPIAIEGPQFSPVPLQQLARETGGTYYGAASSSALADVYSSIAEEFKHTWRIEWVTAARSGETFSVEVTSGGASQELELTAPGLPAPPPVRQEPSKLLPTAFVESSWGPLALGIAVGLILLLAVALAFAPGKGAWLKSRLKPHVEAKRRTVAPTGERKRFALFAALFVATERALGEKRLWRRLGRKLEGADLPLRTVELVYVIAASGFLVGLGAAAAGLSTLAIIGSMLGGALLPYAFVSYKARKRLKAFENQLPDILITMAASLKAGHSFRQGMQSVVEEDMDPASKEFKRVLTETQLGRSMDDALNEMALRVGSKNLEFVISAVTIQRQIGGSLAGLFDMVADTVRQRQQFARKIKALTSMGRMSAYTLLGLPFALAGALTLLNPEYMSPLYHTSAGQKIIIAGFVMMGLGSLVLKKIVSFKG
jgi:tight adherence protein B